MLKKCGNCLQEKPLTEFYRKLERYQARCKDCNAEVVFIYHNKKSPRKIDAYLERKEKEMSLKKRRIQHYRGAIERATTALELAQATKNNYIIQYMERVIRDCTEKIEALEKRKRTNLHKDCTEISESFFSTKKSELLKC